MINPAQPKRSIHVGALLRPGAALGRYRIITVGYFMSLFVLLGSILVEIYPVQLVQAQVLSLYPVDEIVLATMVFSVFMIIYFVREQERVRHRMKAERLESIREGVNIVDREIRNQIILISQATHVAERERKLNPHMIQIIRENNLKIKEHLERLKQVEAYAIPQHLD